MGGAEQRAADWARGGPAEAEALACLRAPELAGVFQKLAGAEVWRERTFEIVLDGAWVTGVFDRVVVERDGAGHAVRATVFDFKTDSVGESATEVAAVVAKHSAQLNPYRRVVAVLTGLEVRAVACELVLTRLRRSVAVPAEENG